MSFPQDGLSLPARKCQGWHHLFTALINQPLCPTSLWLPREQSSVTAQGCYLSLPNLRGSSSCRCGRQFTEVQPSCKPTSVDSFFHRKMCWHQCFREKQSSKRKRGSTSICEDSIEKFKHHLLTEDFIGFYWAHSHGSFQTQLSGHWENTRLPGFAGMLFSMDMNSSSLLLLSPWFQCFNCLWNCPQWMWGFEDRSVSDSISLQP